MLLILAPELREELPRVLGSSDLRDALSNLARAHREGKHILSGPATLLSQLGETRALPEDVRGTFKQIKLRHLDAASLRKQVNHVAVIEAREGDIREEEDGDVTRRRIRVPLSYFVDSERTQATRFVSEDRDDARVYARAAEAYLCRLELKGLTIRLQSYGGSGANTADAIQDHALHGPTLCVVDADYKWSDEEGVPAKGGTAANAIRAARDLANRAVCAVHVVPCREIENLLPSGLLMECFVVTDRGDFHQRCVRAAEVGVLGGGPHVDRLDLKEGLCRKDYESLASGHPQRRYLERVFKQQRSRAPTPVRGWCGDEPRCSGGAPCECVLFAGLGEGLLARVAEKLETLSAPKVAELLLASGRPSVPAWTEIGSLLFAWGCGYPRTRT